jgi:hypothetical protein
MKILIGLLAILISFQLLAAADNVHIYKLNNYPVIDGIAEPLYGPENPIEVFDEADNPSLWTGPEDLSAFFRAGWIGDSIYLFIDVTDDILDKDDAGAPYNNDGVEIYFDGDNTKLESSSDGVNDIQMRIERDKDLGHMIQDAGGMGQEAWWYDSTYTWYVQKEKDDIGYSMECRFYIEGFDIPGDTDIWFGFEVQLNDADGMNRETMLRWHSNSNDTWHWAHLLGNAMLSDTTLFCIQPTILIYIDTLKFGEVAVGTTKSLVLNVHNGCSQALEIYEVYTGNKKYTVEPDYSTVGSYGVKQFTISFTPSTSGINTTTLTFESNDPDNKYYSIILTGTGTGSSGLEDFLAATIPDSYLLFQNYPNPFNPVTCIRYGLPKPGHVEITLYDILGQRIIKLVDEDKKAGYHLINFNANRFASGMYIYRMKSGNFTKVMKMLLIK